MRARVGNVVCSLAPLLRPSQLRTDVEKQTMSLVPTLVVKSSYAPTNSVI